MKERISIKYYLWVLLSSGFLCAAAVAEEKVWECEAKCAAKSGADENVSKLEVKDKIIDNKGTKEKFEIEKQAVPILKKLCEEKAKEGAKGDSIAGGGTNVSVDEPNLKCKEI